MSVHLKVKKCHTCNDNMLHAIGEINKVCARCFTATPRDFIPPTAITPPGPTSRLIAQFEHDYDEDITSPHWYKRGYQAMAEAVPA